MRPGSGTWAAVRYAPRVLPDASPAPPGDEGPELERLLADLTRALREHPSLRAVALRLHDWLGAVLREAEPPQAEAPPAPEPEEDEARRRTMTLSLGSASAAVEVADVGGLPAPHAAEPRPGPRPEPLPAPAAARPAPDLGRVARSARLKAECCRWALTRRRRLAERADLDAVRPRDQELVARARRVPQCDPWPLDPWAALPSDAALEDLAAGYETLAAAAELAQRIHADEAFGSSFRGEVYRLLAEAQSALRLGVKELAQIERDADQQEAFEWLRMRTFEDQIFVPRHMRLDDPADPARWHERHERLGDLERRYEEAVREERERRNAFSRLRYHLQRMARSTERELAREEWARVDEAVAALRAMGVPASNVELRDLLLPLLEERADLPEPGAELREVLEAIDEFLASREREASEGRPRRRERTEALERAARLLRGKVAVLIGGHERARSREALERELGLEELRWLRSRPHVSYTAFEPEIARPETALVLLAIRWSSHSFEQVKQLCQRHKKPFVRLPAGYAPNQVAEQVLAQASDQLS